MNWKINIQDKPNYKIDVRFDPQTESIYFQGKYKGHNMNWAVFSEDKLPMNTNLTDIQTTLFNIYTVMDNRVLQYVDINKTFNAIQNIEIPNNND
jgi:hypothetical protein